MGDPLISTGLNMYFKKIDGFSQDPNSGAGPLNPSQPKESKATLLGLPFDTP